MGTFLLPQPSGSCASLGREWLFPLCRWPAGVLEASRGRYTWPRGIVLPSSKMEQVQGGAAGLELYSQKGSLHTSLVGLVSSMSSNVA